MGIAVQTFNGAGVSAETALELFQQHRQNGNVNGATSSNGAAEGVTTQSQQEGGDRVRLSAAAMQAFAAAKLPVRQGSDPNQPENSGAAEQVVASDVATAADSVPTSAAGDTPRGSSPVSAYQRQAGVDGAKPSSDPNTMDNKNSTGVDELQLSPEAQQKLLELQKRDQEVKMHEAAHAAVGGRYAGAPSITYETGPNGKRYAVSGEVQIDVSEVPGDPAATMQKADIIRAAALAPAHPSAQDRKVAAKATQMKLKAQSELLAQTAAAANEMVKNSQFGAQQVDVAQRGLSMVHANQFKGAIA